MIYVKIGVHRGYHKHFYDFETCSFHLTYQQYAKNARNINILKNGHGCVIAATECNNILVIEQW